MWEFMNDFINELRRRIKELENELNQFFVSDVQVKDDIDEGAIEPLVSFNETPDMIIVSLDMPFVDQNTIEAKLIDERHLLVKARIQKGIHSSKLDSTYPSMEFKNYKCLLSLPVNVKKISRFSVRRDILTIYLVKK